MNNTSHLPQRIHSMVELELQSGERITWMDQPIPGRLAAGTWPVVLFGIPWTAFALFWMGAAGMGTWSMPSDGEGTGFFKLFRLFPLFGLPFILVGIGMLSSPFWAIRRAHKTAYVLTDRRAFIMRAGWRGSVTTRSFEPERLGDLRRKEHRDGSGHLVFAEDVCQDSEGGRCATDVGFLAVRDVKTVEEMVLGLAKKAPPHRAKK